MITISLFVQFLPNGGIYSLASKTEYILHLSEESSLLFVSCLVYCAAGITVQKFLTALSCNVHGAISSPMPHLCPLEQWKISPCPLPWDIITLPNLSKMAGSQVNEVQFIWPSRKISKCQVWIHRPVLKELISIPMVPAPSKAMRLDGPGPCSALSSPLHAGSKPYEVLTSPKTRYINSSVLLQHKVQKEEMASGEAGGRWQARGGLGGLQKRCDGALTPPFRQWSHLFFCTPWNLPA